MKRNVYKAPYGSLEDKYKKSKKISLSTKFKLAGLIMLPIGLVSWLITSIITYLFKIDNQDVAALMVIIGIILFVVIGSVIWTDPKNKLMKSISNIRNNKKKLKLEKELNKDPWEL